MIDLGATKTKGAAVLSLASLMGQDEVQARLDRQLMQDRLPHALVFEGPRGVGKGTAVEILTRILLCERRDANGTAACGECPACVKLETGTHADVQIVEREGAFVKIDAIRAASRGLSLRPVEGTRKILVVHEADRMNPAAQNALLKTLEEPPGAAHIFLLTDRPQLLLPTVLSRCGRVRFVPLPVEAVKERLLKEGLPPNQAELVAAMTHGSLGDALATDADDLMERRDTIAALDAALSGPLDMATTAAVEQAQELNGKRPEVKAMLDLLLAWLHDQVVIASGAQALLANADRRPALDAAVQRTALPVILDRARAVLEAQRQIDLPTNYNAQSILEQLFLSYVGHGRMPEVSRNFG